LATLGGARSITRFPHIYDAGINRNRGRNKLIVPAIIVAGGI
jgi:hypothetical protein